MPLLKRTVQPSYLCRQQLPENGINELEMVTNNTLAGIIAQLSDISRHAEDIFGELTNEAHQFNDRCLKLGERIVNLSNFVSLESQGQKSNPLIIAESAKNREVKIDTQVVDRKTLPKALIATYEQADAPPRLEILTQYRDDNKSCLAIYTNPDYFFQFWRDKLKKEVDAKREHKKARKRRQKEKQQQMRINNQKPIDVDPSRFVARHREEQQRKAKGKEFMDSSYIRSKQAQENIQKTQRDSGNHSMSSNTPSLPSHAINQTNNSFPQPPLSPEQDFPAPPPISPFDQPPPPPSISQPPRPQPPPLSTIHNISTPAPTEFYSPLPPQVGPPGAPPPPPPPGQGPPPPPPGPGPPGPPGPPPPPGAMSHSPAPISHSQQSKPSSGRGALLEQIRNPGNTLKKTSDRPVEPPVIDSRTNLLDDIRKGKQLKKVQQTQQQSSAKADGMDVGNDIINMLNNVRRACASDSEDSGSDWDDSD